MANPREILKQQLKDREKNTKLFVAKLTKLLDNYLPKAVNFKGVDLNEAASVVGGLMQGLKDAGLQKVLDELNDAYAEELHSINRLLSTSVSGKVFSSIDKEVIDSLIDYNGEKITRLVAPYIDDVGSTALRYAITGETPDIDAIMTKTSDVLESQITTEVDTLLSSFSRTVTAKKADDFGLELFLYYGPDDKITRDFCHELLSEKPPIYTKDEILSMDNGQGLDVLTNCGGYNCRHQWLPITEEKALELGYKI